jgi:hypothetical protein
MTQNEPRPRRPRGRAVRPAAWCAALAAVAVLIAGCATATSTGSAARVTAKRVIADSIATPSVARGAALGQPATSAARAYPLCDGRNASRIRLRRLVVTRTARLTANAARHPNGRWVVRSTRRMRQVQRALCALPKPPAGVYNCPVDLGISYRLRYHAARGVLPAVIADATGCQVVTGLGKSARWAAETPRFWRALGRAIGVRSLRRIT